MIHLIGIPMLILAYCLGKENKKKILNGTSETDGGL